MPVVARKAKDDRHLQPDSRLVRACLDGDEEAWAALIDRYKNLIFSIPIKYRFSQEDAADIFQAVCADLLSELAQLRKPEALAQWLIQVASHKCLQRKLYMARYGRLDPAMPEPATQKDELPDYLLAQAQNEQILRQAICEVSPRCREMIHWLFFEHPPRPYQEIAERLGIATGSIGFIRGRCLEKLRQRLEQMGFK
jgi:RNA polymerase sigma factor (sigma-70 family)